MTLSNIIQVPINASGYTVTNPITKEDYGLHLQFEGADLPSTYQVDFSDNQLCGDAVTVIGDSNGVLIPQQLISKGLPIYAFLYLTDESCGRTVYKIKIPNNLRPNRTEEEPTPAQESIIDQMINVLNDVAESVPRNIIGNSQSGGIVEGFVSIPDGVENPEWAPELVTNSADGDNAHAEGGYLSYQPIPGGGGYYISYPNTASGKCAHAEGADCIASGGMSHAEGSGTEAQSACSHAEGTRTIASGSSAHAEGNQTVASGYESHAEGGATEASGLYTHAEGYYSKATASYAHAEGDGCIASGMRSHAQNNSTTASGAASTACGANTVASGISATVCGEYTTASGRASMACGSGANASGDYQTAIGKYNVIDSNSDYALVIGNGTNGNNRSNAFAIKWDGTFVFANGTEITPTQFAALLALLT